MSAEPRRKRHAVGLRSADDGRGGADPPVGSGLQGLVDRIAGHRRERSRSTALHGGGHRPPSAHPGAGMTRTRSEPRSHDPLRSSSPTTPSSCARPSRRSLAAAGSSRRPGRQTSHELLPLSVRRSPDVLVDRRAHAPTHTTEGLEAAAHPSVTSSVRDPRPLAYIETSVTPSTSLRESPIVRRLPAQGARHPHRRPRRRRPSRRLRASRSSTPKSSRVSWAVPRFALPARRAHPARARDPRLMAEAARTSASPSASCSTPRRSRAT